MSKILDKALKDITYPAEDILAPTNLKNLVDNLGQQDSDTFWRLSAPIMHARLGAQLWVSQEVSDDLLASDVDNPDFSNLQWPHDRLEVVFEDPAIGSFLAHHGSRKSTAAEYCKLSEGLAKIRVEGTVEDILTTIQMEFADGAVASTALHDVDMDNFAATGYVNEDVRQRSSLSFELDETESGEMREAATILFKILLFASSKGFAPRVTRDKPTKRQGGKPGFKNRPKTDRLIIEYLPHHATEKDAARKEAQRSGKQKFNGRRGHWRCYKSERYTAEVRGTRDFIMPVWGPDGTIPKRKYVVRKEIPTPTVS